MHLLSNHVFWEYLERTIGRNMATTLVESSQIYSKCYVFLVFFVINNIQSWPASLAKATRTTKSILAHMITGIRHDHTFALDRPMQEIFQLYSLVVIRQLHCI